MGENPRTDLLEEHFNASCCCRHPGSNAGSTNIYMITKPFLTKLFWSIIKKKKILWRGKHSSSLLCICPLCPSYYIHRAFYFWHLCHKYGVGVLSPQQQAGLQHQLDILQFNSVWTLFTQRFCQVPQVRAQSHRLLPPHPQNTFTPYLQAHTVMHTHEWPGL